MHKSQGNYRHAHFALPTTLSAGFFRHGPYTLCHFCILDENGPWDILKVTHEIVENRRWIHAEIRHENRLFLTGQEEYKNPFNGQTALGTCDYRHRWVNNQGELLYTDENSFGPNRYEEYNTRE
jgi:hypothetical protein